MKENCKNQVKLIVSLLLTGKKLIPGCYNCIVIFIYTCYKWICRLLYRSIQFYEINNLYSMKDNKNGKNIYNIWLMHPINIYNYTHEHK